MLSAKILASVVATLTEVQDLGSASAPIGKTYRTVLTDGVAAGQADKIFHDTRTLAASATEDLDLAGVLSDPLGDVLTLAKIKGLIISAAAANANDVIVGAAAGSPWLALLGAAGTVTLRPGATLAVFCGAADAAGYAVVAGTGDLLKVANSAGGTGVDYDVIIIGTSA